MMIVALAGRRIDPTGASVQRFPLSNVPQVLEQLRQYYAQHSVRAVVCSAACGSDLLGVRAAVGMGIRYRIILPFSRAKFRATSVIDRPGDWGPEFDSACQAAKQQRDLRFVRAHGTDHDAYLRTTTAILEHAQELATTLFPHEGDAKTSRVQALVLWDGAPRGPDDLTAQFMQQAKALGIEVAEIRTL